MVLAWFRKVTPPTNYLEIRDDEESKYGMINIPFCPQVVNAGQLNGVKDTTCTVESVLDNHEVRESCTRDYEHVIPVLKSKLIAKSLKNIAAFRIEGRSMMPKFRDGLVMAAEKIFDSRSMENEKPYIIITKNLGLVLKLYHKTSDGKHVALKSINKSEFPDYTIDESDIVSIWEPIGEISPCKIFPF